jgi:hypothetical protein
VEVSELKLSFSHRRNELMAASTILQQYTRR